MISRPVGPSDEVHSVRSLFLGYRLYRGRPDYFGHACAEEYLVVRSPFMLTKCTLCDISIDTPSLIQDQQPFCCHGCKAVYTILLSKNALDNPRESPVFLQALQAGIISNPQLLEELSTTKRKATNRETYRWHLEIGEMWCPTCADLLRWVLLRENGVVNCVVDYATDLASIEFDPMETSKDKLSSIVAQLGYTTLALDDANARPVSKGLYLRLAIASFCSLNVMMLAYPLYATFFDSDVENVSPLFAWISLGLSVPVLLYCAWPIYSKFWHSIKAGLLGMEALVTLGIAASTGLSLYELARGTNQVYFDSMTVIVAFVLLGKTLEARAKFSAKEAFLKLTRALPRRGRKVNASGDCEFVPVKDLAVGDTLVAFAGEKIVLDGKVNVGVGVCDESIMTGEPVPVTKREGDLVVAGTVLQQGELRYTVTTPPEKSLLSRIVEMTHGELGKKRAYIRPADTIVQWFIPAVFVVAAATGMAILLTGGSANTAVLRMTAILLISCPCAIGIAAPIVEGYLINALAQEGVIIRNRGVLSLLGKEDAYIFDKTGTVTNGHFSVLKGVDELSPTDQSILRKLVSHSNHLASRAIKDAIHYDAATEIDVVEVISKGMIGTRGNDRYLLGSRAFMLESGVVIPNESNPTTTCYFAANGELVTQIHLGDTIREGVFDTIRALNQTTTVLLSGDHEAAVQQIAKECRFTLCAWEHTPAQKMEYVQNVIEKGGVVAMVGDGINDAPALTAAHIGISVVTASDLSIQVSDILLTTPKLTVIPKMRKMANLARMVVKQNLFWAFIYNVAGIAIAAAGWLTPLYAAAAMVLSSLMVVANAQRIKSL